jgi:hypothetical protein
VILKTKDIPYFPGAYYFEDMKRGASPSVNQHLTDTFERASNK